MFTLLLRVVTKAMSPFVPGKAAPATVGSNSRTPNDTAAAASRLAGVIAQGRDHLPSIRNRRVNEHPKPVTSR